MEGEEIQKRGGSVDRGRHGIRFLYGATCKENRLTYTGTHICPKSLSIQMKSPSCRLFLVPFSPSLRSFLFFRSPFVLAPFAAMQRCNEWVQLYECRVPCITRGRKKRKGAIKCRRRMKKWARVGQTWQVRGGNNTRDKLGRVRWWEGSHVVSVSVENCAVYFYPRDDNTVHS